jgi:hypothetical protein
MATRRPLRKDATRLLEMEAFEATVARFFTEVAGVPAPTAASGRQTVIANATRARAHDDDFRENGNTTKPLYRSVVPSVGQKKNPHRSKT